LDPFQPDFSYTSRTLAYCLDGQQTGREPDQDFYVAFNAWRQPLPFLLPPAPNGIPGQNWRRVIDTSLASPQDIVDFENAPRLEPGRRYMVAPHAAVVLLAEK
jgi:glycogen operon protein